MPDQYIIQRGKKLAFLLRPLIIVAGDCGFGFEQQGYYEKVYNRNREAEGSGGVGFPARDSASRTMPVAARRGQR